MKVVFANNFAHLTGGADQHCFGLVEELRRRGHEVRFLATADERNVEHDGIFVRCRVSHSTRESLSPAEQARAFTGALWNSDAARAMTRLVDEFRPDLVHSHKLYPQLSVAPVVVAARRRVPVVQTLHDFELVSASAIDVRGGWIDRDETRFRYRFLNAATLPVRRRVHVPRVSTFVAVSRFVARVHATHGIDAEVLPNFVPLRARTEPGFDERDGIVFYGRLRPEKGVGDVVEMARMLPDIPVTIAGAGMLEDSVRRESSAIPNLRVIGYVPNGQLLDLLAHARVVVIPSRCQDAGPLVPLEALATATPVVAYSNGGLAEYVIDTGGGLVVPPDPVTLASAAAELHGNADAWRRHSERGHEAIVARHTPEVYTARLEELYERACAGVV